METATGRVSSVHDGVATVVVAAPVACKRCESGKGCGAGLLTGSEKPGEMEIGVPAGMTLRPGDQVTLAVAPRQLLRAASLAYGLPLLSMVVFVAFAWVSGESAGDATAIAFGVAGLTAGVWLSRRILARGAVCESFVPVIESHGADAGG